MAVCTLLTVLLPETNKTPLPDTTVEISRRDYTLDKDVEEVSEGKTAKNSSLEI